MLIKSALVPFKRQNSVTTMIAIWFFGQQRLFAERGWLLCPADQSLNNSFLLRLV
jgi:hypothetical protein